MGLFDVVLSFEDVSATKPDPEGLFIITKKYKLNSADLIMVGDSKADVLAGKAFGAYTVAYINNEAKAKEVKTLSPNACVDNLIELLDILKNNHYFTYNGKQFN